MSQSVYLLTGGGGTLGTELQKYLNCWAPSRNILDIKMTRREMAEKLYFHFDMAQCKGIIHCAAYTDVAKSETKTKEVIETNIIGTRNIVKFARMYSLPVYHISTDYVYEGLEVIGGYKETSDTKPFNLYGYSKLAAEAFLDTDRDLVIRTSFKPGDLWETKYNSAFVDIWSSSDYIDVVAPDIAWAIHSDLRGIYNIATERKSIFELAIRRNPDVQEMSRWDLGASLNMPRDISMNISKYNKFKEDSIKEFGEFIGRAK